MSDLLPSIIEAALNGLIYGQDRYEQERQINELRAAYYGRGTYRRTTTQKINGDIEETSAPAFFAKAEMGSVRFQQRKISWRLLPSAARVRPAPVAVHNSPSVRCALLTYANDFTPCRDVLAF